MRVMKEIIGFGNEKPLGWMTTELFVIWKNHFISHEKPKKSKTNSSFFGPPQ